MSKLQPSTKADQLQLDYDVWLANSDSDKQNSVEQNATQQKRSTWLEPGDTVKVVEVDHDTLRVSIITSIASDRAKQCWTLSYAGYLFEDR